MRISIGLAFLIGSFTLVLTADNSAAAQSGPKQALVQGNTEFALDLYAQLAQEKGNLFFSPYSISTALAMTYEGARGNTAAQMNQVLHLPVPQEGVSAAFAELIHQVQNPKDKAKYK